MPLACLAVPDAIGDLRSHLERSLETHRLRVSVLTFPESKLKNHFTKLRAGLALAPGVTLAMADQLAEVDDE